jgi:hypothetical protein
MRQIQQAQKVAQSGALDFLWEQEQSLVNRLVSAHRGGKLTDRDAAVGIAVISEVRYMSQVLETALTKGIEEARKITTKE